MVTMVTYGLYIVFTWKSDGGEKNVTFVTTRYVNVKIFVTSIYPGVVIIKTVLTLVRFLSCKQRAFIRTGAWGKQALYFYNLVLTNGLRRSPTNHQNWVRHAIELWCNPSDFIVTIVFRVQSDFGVLQLCCLSLVG